MKIIVPWKEYFPECAAPEERKDWAVFYRIKGSDNANHWGWVVLRNRLEDVVTRTAILKASKYARNSFYKGEQVEFLEIEILDKRPVDVESEVFCGKKAKAKGGQNERKETCDDDKSITGGGHEGP